MHMVAKPSRDELAQLDNAALVELVVQLLDKIEQLEAQLPPTKPPTTSSNSSQPPSRDQNRSSVLHRRKPSMALGWGIRAIPVTGSPARIRYSHNGCCTAMAAALI